MLTATENPCYQYAATINDDAGQNVEDVVDVSY